jgi:hypothetical protein
MDINTIFEDFIRVWQKCGKPEGLLPDDEARLLQNLLQMSLSMRAVAAHEEFVGIARQQAVALERIAAALEPL